MEDIKIIDNENFLEDSRCGKILEKNEQLYWSGRIFKTNYLGKIQKRLFLLTNKRIINLGNNLNFLFKLFKRSINRSIIIETIEGVTYSKLSNNFLFHIPSEYDYYICCEKKDELLLQLIKIISSKGRKGLPFYFVEDIDLMKYCQIEGTKETKWPKSEIVLMDEKKFSELILKKNLKLEESLKNTEIIVSKKGEVINETSFNILKVLGKGHFGTVFLVQKKDNEKLYALKVISKLEVIKNKFFTQLKNEKKIMEKIENPFVVSLEYCFANSSYVFFAMEFKQGGELYHHLRKYVKFSEQTTKFYAAQIISGILYLHQNNIMYRDLKPENILLDEKGNACLADFGISKILEKNEKTKTYIGTPEYVAPEIVLRSGHDKAVDIWCFGILLYEMVYSIAPFFNDNYNLMMNWIVKMEPTFPESIKVSNDFKDLVKKVF